MEDHQAHHGRNRHAHDTPRHKSHQKPHQKPRHKLRLILAFGGLIHAGVGVRAVEERTVNAPIHTALPTAPGTAMEATQAVTLLCGIIGFGLAIGGLGDSDEEDGGAPSADRTTD